MPAALARTLTPEQRDLLWNEAWLELEVQTGICEQGEGGRAELCDALQRASDFVRLYDDLGWEEVDERESYTLSMADDQLERIGAYLRTSARELLRDETTGPFAENCPDRIDHNLEVLHVVQAIGGDT